jgi:hypothetical protein
VRDGVGRLVLWGRSSQITACWRMNRWHVRCSVRQLYCSGLGHNELRVGSGDASQMASASIASSLCRFTYGFAYWRGFNGQLPTCTRQIAELRLLTIHTFVSRYGLWRILLHREIRHLHRGGQMRRVGTGLAVTRMAAAKRIRL